MKLVLDGSPITPQQVQQLIDLVKSAGATVWKAALEQVYATAIVNLVIGIVAAIVFVVMTITAIKGLRKAIANQDPGYYEDDNKQKDTRQKNEVKAWVQFFVSMVLVVLSFPTAFATLQTAVYYLMAPDYAAIQVLTKLVPGQ